MERNALRAELVVRAEDWKWSSLPGRMRVKCGCGEGKCQSGIRGGWSGLTQPSQERIRR
jgi:hypothetical protein